MTLPDKKNIKKSFSNAAKLYNKNAVVQKIVGQHLFEYIQNNLKTQPLNIVEIGSGTGNLTHILRQNFPSSTIIACDFSFEKINSLKTKNILKCVMDGESFCFSKKFDLIASNMCVQWFHKLEESLLSLLENLNDGGFLALSFPTDQSFLEWKDIAPVNNLIDLPSKEFILNTFPNASFSQEKFSQKFQSAYDFAEHLKIIGANTSRKNNHKPSITQMRKMKNISPFVVTYDIAYLLIKKV